jgi:hypothetical protein
MNFVPIPENSLPVGISWYPLYVVAFTDCELICIRISKDVSEEETVSDPIHWFSNFDDLYDREQRLVYS